MSQFSSCVWIDLDNSPHVPFFRPIIDELRQRGTNVVVTARDAYNVDQLLGVYGVDAKLIGWHAGGNKVMKVLGLTLRCAQLLPHVLRQRPSLAVSHGSRAQLLAAKLLGVPTAVLADYEHVVHVAQPDYMIVPQVLAGGASAQAHGRVRTYPGIKEDVYACGFVPDANAVACLALLATDIVATLRPPATEAHYHNPESETLFAAAVAHLASDQRTRLVLLPRNARQREAMCREHAALIGAGKMIVPAAAIEGLNLVWHSDFVVSGGGTMNREAAALGVPVYSTFRGQIGQVDRYLEQQGRIVLLESVADVQRRLKIEKRVRPATPAQVGRHALDAVVDHIANMNLRHAVGKPAVRGSSS